MLSDYKHASFVQITGNNSLVRAGADRLDYGKDDTSKDLSVRALWDVGTTTFTATDGENQLNTALIVHVFQEVTLDKALSDGTVTFAAGTVIPTTRITGWHIAGPDECPGWHMHADNPDGIRIDGHLFPDPNKSGCGYGMVIQP